MHKKSGCARVPGGTVLGVSMSPMKDVKKRRTEGIKCFSVTVQLRRGKESSWKIHERAV